MKEGVRNKGDEDLPFPLICSSTHFTDILQTFLHTLAAVSMTPKNVIPLPFLHIRLYFAE